MKFVLLALMLNKFGSFPLKPHVVLIVHADKLPRQTEMVMKMCLILQTIFNNLFPEESHTKFLVLSHEMNS